MKAWLLSVASTVLLTVLIELLLSEGTIKKYVQGFVRLLLLFVIITPFIKLVKGDISIDLFDFGQEKKISTELNSYALIRQRYDHIEKMISQDLYSDTQSNAIVKIMDASVDGATVISYIEINIDTSGINEDSDNILLKEKILSVIKKYIDIPEEKIIINGVD